MRKSCPRTYKLPIYGLSVDCAPSSKESHYFPAKSLHFPKHTNKPETWVSHSLTCRYVALLRTDMKNITRCSANGDEKKKKRKTSH